MLKAGERAHGGKLRSKRKGRGARPLACRSSMHLVLRSSVASGAWSFRKHKNAVEQISRKFAARNGIRIISLANVGNHLHYHIQLSNRFAYHRFIRGLTAALMMAVTGTSRWSRPQTTKFWDLRPFTRIVIGRRAYLALADYIRINWLEGQGVKRRQAENYVYWKWKNSA